MNLFLRISGIPDTELARSAVRLALAQLSDVRHISSDGHRGGDYRIALGFAPFTRMPKAILCEMVEERLREMYGQDVHVQEDAEATGNR